MQTYSTIAGLWQLKKIVDETVIDPFLDDIARVATAAADADCHQRRRQSRTVLLAGPAGCGKTVFAAAIAERLKERAAKHPSSLSSASIEINAKTYNGGDIITKWLDPSQRPADAAERLEREVFASSMSPSIVVINDLDSLVAGPANATKILDVLCGELNKINFDHQRGIIDGQHRLVVATSCGGLVASSLPPRLIHCFSRRLFVTLPSMLERVDFLKLQLSSTPTSSSSTLFAAKNCIKSELSDLRSEEAQAALVEIAAKADGMTQADLSCVVRDAAMMPIRDLMAGRSMAEVQKMSKDEAEAAVRAVTKADFLKALGKVRPSIRPEDVERFEADEASVGAGQNLVKGCTLRER